MARLENRVRRIGAVRDHEASGQKFGARQAQGILRHVALLRLIISRLALAAVGANCLLRAPARRANVLTCRACRALAAHRIHVAVSVRPARRLVVLIIGQRAHSAVRAGARDGALRKARNSVILRRNHDSNISIIHVAHRGARVVARDARQTEPILATGAPAAAVQSHSTVRAQRAIRVLRTLASIRDIVIWLANRALPAKGICGGRARFQSIIAFGALCAFHAAGAGILCVVRPAWAGGAYRPSCLTLIRPCLANGAPAAVQCPNIDGEHPRWTAITKRGAGLVVLRAGTANVARRLIVLFLEGTRRTDTAVRKAEPQAPRRVV